MINELFLNNMDIVFQITSSDLIDYVDENQNDLICAAVPALNTFIKDIREAYKNAIKAEGLEHQANQIFDLKKIKLFEKLRKFAPKISKIYNKIIEVYQFKKEILDPQMKKLKDYLQKHNLRNIDKLNLKGFKIGVGGLDLFFLGYSVYNIWDNKDLNFYDKIKQTINEIFGFIGGTFLGGIGAELGATLGALLCPTMPILGAAIGIFIGAFFLGMLGNWIGKGIYKAISEISKIFSGIIDDDNDGFGIGIIGLIRPPNDGDGGGGGSIGGGDGGGGPSPCAPAMRVGGVEFLLPKQIDNFRNFFSFNKCHYIAFEYEHDNFNIEKIIDLVNSKFLINNIKVKSLDEIYDTILKEISYGFLCQKELPSISLNFNKDGLLYSIMDNFYKNTLTGNILTFLDYYLKSYANGAFFKEEFIYEWQKEKNQDFDYLSRYLIDFKRYIFDTVNDPNQLNYCSIYDLFVPGLDMSYENNYISAFRIIGNIHSNLSYYKNMFFPNCFYYTQYDFNIMPKWMKKINEEIIKEINENQGEKQEENVKREKGKEEISSIILDEIHKIMANRVTILMKKIPFLQPYFELLKMITFAIHYLPNIHRTGLFPIFNKSIQNNHINIKYCKSIPKVFPPLPIRKTVTLEVEVTPIELLNCFKNNDFKEINNFIYLLL